MPKTTSLGELFTQHQIHKNIKCERESTFTPRPLLGLAASPSSAARFALIAYPYITYIT